MSDCACVYSDGADYGADVSLTRTVRARKAHECCECREAITPGQSYEITTGCWDGEWSTYKTCLPCVEIRKALFCEGWSYTSVWRDIREALPVITAKCLEKLSTVAAKQKLTDKWREWNGLAGAPQKDGQ